VRNIGILVTVVLVATLAYGEGVEGTRSEGPSNRLRLRGAVTIRPFPSGLISLGGSYLRYLPKGSQAWTTLHREPGDNLYRIASDNSGRLLASWEKDPFLHLFKLPGKQHLRIPKPVPSAEFYSFLVEDIAFSPNGRDAVVFIRGTLNGGVSQKPSLAFRVPLDGKSQPELLYRVEYGNEIHTSPRGGVYVIPQKPGQRCEWRACRYIAAIIAYEITGSGVKQKNLLTSAQAAMAAAYVVNGSNDERVVVMVELDKRQRALLRWRFGDDEPGYRPIPRPGPWDDLAVRAFVTGKDEFIEVRNENSQLEIIRHLPEGGEQVISLPGLLQQHDTTVHGLGLRGDGSFWVHWGDHLGLLSPGKPPRAFNLEPLLERKTEWGSADIYLEKPEVLWIGLELGAGRDFLRVDFADAEKRSQPWQGAK
jgi:hypothetical protein